MRNTLANIVYWAGRMCFCISYPLIRAGNSLYTLGWELQGCPRIGAPLPPIPAGREES
jgi:hypothetical protein